MRLTPRQREVLEFMAAHRGKEGVRFEDHHEEKTTVASLLRKRLVGYYVPRQQWIQSRYKITPRGRAALEN
jgi:hypothetical protein